MSRPRLVRFRMDQVQNGVANGVFARVEDKGVIKDLAQQPPAGLKGGGQLCKAE